MTYYENFKCKLKKVPYYSIEYAAFFSSQFKKITSILKLL